MKGIICEDKSTAYEFTATVRKMGTARGRHPHPKDTWKLIMEVESHDEEAIAFFQAVGLKHKPTILLTAREVKDGEGT